MRILFVNRKCGYFGGIEQNLADTAAGLRERGHQCFLAFEESTGRQMEQYQAAFERCLPIHPFAEALAAVKPEVVYIHKVNVSALGGIPPVRTVRMVHDHDLCCPRRHKYFAWNNRVCHQPAGWRCYADLAFVERARGPLKVGLVSIGARIREMRENQRLPLVLVGSEAMRQSLIGNGFAPNTVQILPPVVRMAERDMAPLPAENRLLYVGQLIRGKGVDLLLGALSHLRGHFDLTIAGTGNARTRLERQCAQLGLNDKVRFAGWVNPDALGAYYRGAKVVIVPSRWPEPFGMIGLEAMHYGRPVVAFSVGGIPDWLEDDVTGMLAPEQDVQAMAKALDKLLADPVLCERLGRQAQQQVRVRFSFEDYLSRLEGFLS